MSNLTSVTNENFEAEVLKASRPVLVDFWAEWCGPCKAIGPVLDELADEYADKLKIVKVNVDEAHEVAQKHGIRSIPTLMLFKDGENQETKVGALNKGQLKDMLAEHGVA